jgi:hypothetical protein
MFIAEFENPFRSFLAAAGAPQYHIDVIPPTSRHSLLGSCSFLDDSWRHYNDIPKLTSRPLLFLISLDGIASKELYHYWENNRLKDAANLLIPDFILNASKPIILFDNSAEGHCDEFIFKFVSQVVDQFKLNPLTTFYGNSAVNIKSIHRNSPYSNFRSIYTNNYKEDTVSHLFDEISQYAESENSSKYLYSCLNNAPRPHRALFLGALIDRGLDTSGYISSPSVPFEELFSLTTEYMSIELKHGALSIKEFNRGIAYLNCLAEKYPLVLDSPQNSDIHMETMSLDTDFIQNMMSCDIDIVTETFVDNTIYITEKIFKPIMMKRPFMVLGASKTLDTLIQQGYNVYRHLYADAIRMDKETSIMQSISMMVDNVETLLMKKDSPALWQDITEQNAAIATHNYNNFIDRKTHIMQSSKNSFETWLNIYSDYLEVFNCYD